MSTGTCRDISGLDAPDACNHPFDVGREHCSGQQQFGGALATLMTAGRGSYYSILTYLVYAQTGTLARVCWSALHGGIIMSNVQGFTEA